MKAPTEGKIDGGRWIRPAEGTSLPGLLRHPEGAGVDDLAGRILIETRRRVSALAALERDLEDKIRSRWKDGEEEIRRRIVAAEETVEARLRRAESEAKEAKLRAEKEGRTSGFREGFSRGREEGFRLGMEEGRRDGHRDGHREGREEAARKVEEELSGAASALAEAAVLLRTRAEGFLREARTHVLRLAIEIAKRIVKMEVTSVRETVVRNVEKAVDLIFRRGSIAIQVNPEDAPAVERALAAEPRWSEEFDAVEVRAVAEVSRGGCRLISGAGTVDMTIETQFQLIETALEGANEDPVAPPPPAYAAPDRGRPAGRAAGDGGEA